MSDDCERPNALDQDGAAAPLAPSGDGPAGHRRKPRRTIDRFGERMRDARLVAELSTADAAEALGLGDQKVLERIEGGGVCPAGLLPRVAVLYQVTTDWLCGLADEPDRDRAVVAMRFLATRVTAEASRMVDRLTEVSIQAARDLAPDPVLTTRMAADAVESIAAFERVLALNPSAQHLSGFDNLRLKLDALMSVATDHLAKVNRDRLKRQAGGRSAEAAPDLAYLAGFDIDEIVGLARASKAMRADLASRRRPG